MDIERAKERFYDYSKGAGSSAPHAYLIRINKLFKDSGYCQNQATQISQIISDGIKTGEHYKSIFARVRSLSRNATLNLNVMECKPIEAMTQNYQLALLL